MLFALSRNGEKSAVKLLKLDDIEQEHLP